MNNVFKVDQDSLQHVNDSIKEYNIKRRKKLNSNSDEF
jgi:hypothetical protein